MEKALESLIYSGMTFLSLKQKLLKPCSGILFGKIPVYGKIVPGNYQDKVPEIFFGIMETLAI